MGEHLIVKYSCYTCGLKDVEVPVPYRQSEQIVTDWMEKVVIALLGQDHMVRSPFCTTQRLQDLKIPVPDGTQFIGGPVTH